MGNYSKKNKSFSTGSYHVKLINNCLQNCEASAATADMATALQRAALINDLTAINALLDRGVSVNASDEIGRTPLMEAVFSGNQAAVSLLILRGADVNISDQDGWTALMEASSKGRFEIARILLFSGADPKARNKTGTTARDLTAKGHLKLLKLLTDAGRTELAS